MGSNHKEDCKCAFCKPRIPNRPRLFKCIHKNTNEDAVFKKLTKAFKNQILKQLCFSLAPRGSKLRLDIVSKIFQDQLIPINVYKFQLINCRKCKTISKATLTSRLKCLRCTNNQTVRMRDSVTWDTWAIDP